MWLQVELPQPLTVTELQFESAPAVVEAEPAAPGAPTRTGIPGRRTRRARRGAAPPRRPSAIPRVRGPGVDGRHELGTADRQGQGHRHEHQRDVRAGAREVRAASRRAVRRTTATIWSRSKTARSRALTLSALAPVRSLPFPGQRPGAQCADGTSARQAARAGQETLVCVLLPGWARQGAGQESLHQLTGPASSARC